MLHHIEMIRSRVEGMFGQGDAGVPADRISAIPISFLTRRGDL
jgi:hypothetical protein